MNVYAIDAALIDHRAIYPVSEDGSQTVAQEEPAAVAPEQEETEIITGDESEAGTIFTNDAPRVKGVIRHLQEGHFKGVADVRLRINFNDEIAALEGAEKARVTENGIADIMASVNFEIDTFLRTEELDEEAKAAIIEALNDLNSGLPGETGELTDQLRSGFYQFIASLNTALGVSPENPVEEPAEVAAPVENPEQPAIETAIGDDTPAPAAEKSSPIDYRKFIAELVEKFATQLEELESSLAGISVIPELSEPHGNGVAYEKFLAAYIELRGNTEPAVAPEVIDTIM